MCEKGGPGGQEPRSTHVVFQSQGNIKAEICFRQREKGSLSHRKEPEQRKKWGQCVERCS